MATSKKSNIVLTERSLHTFKEDINKTPHNDIRENIRENNSLRLGEILRDTAIVRHQVEAKSQNDKYNRNTPNSAKENDGKITKNRRNPFKFTVVEGNQDTGEKETNEFDEKFLKHYESNNQFRNGYNVVVRELNRYLKGIGDMDTIKKFKHRVKVNNENDSFNYAWEDNAQINEKRKMKFTYRYPNNSLDISNDRELPNSDDEAKYSEQPKEKAKIFNNYKLRSYINESTIETGHFGTTTARNRLEWKLLDKATTLYEVIKKRKLMQYGPKSNNLHSDIGVNDIMKALHSFGNVTSFIDSNKTSKPITILNNIIPSFKNAHAYKMFFIDANNEGANVKYTTVTPSKLSKKSIDKIFNRNSFDLEQTSSDVFTNLSSESILNYKVKRPIIKLPSGKNVAAKTNPDGNVKQTLYREKKKVKLKGKDLDDYYRKPSKIAKYKKRLHPNLSDLNDLVKKMTIFNSTEDTTKNAFEFKIGTTTSENNITGSLIKPWNEPTTVEPVCKFTLLPSEENNDKQRNLIPKLFNKNKANLNVMENHNVSKPLFNHTISSVEEAENDGEKLRKYDNSMENGHRPATKNRDLQNIAILSPTLRLESLDNATTLSFKKHLMQETTTITNIRDVSLNFLRNLTNIKPTVKVGVSQDNIEPKEQNDSDDKYIKTQPTIGTFKNFRESAIDKILPTDLNKRRSELEKLYKDKSAKSPPRYGTFKPPSSTEIPKAVLKYKMKFDLPKTSNIMQLNIATENHETTTTTYKHIRNPTFAERILTKIPNLKTGTYDTPMLKRKLKEAESRLRNSLIKYLNGSGSVKKDLAKSSLAPPTYPRPVLFESLKYPSVFDAYPNIGYWRPKLQLGSGVPTIVTNISNDLTNEKMPPMRYWNAVIPPFEPAFYTEEENTFSPTVYPLANTEIPVYVTLQNKKRKQKTEEKKSQFHYNSRFGGKYSKNLQIPSVRVMYKAAQQDKYSVSTTTLAIPQEIPRQKVRKKLLEQIEGVRNKDLIKILFSSPYLNHHLKWNLNLKKQPQDVFNKDMYSVLPLDVVNYQKYKKEDRQPPKNMSDKNFYNQPRWVLPINYKNKPHGELQSSDDSVRPLDKLTNDFLDGTKRDETTTFSPMDVEDLVSDLADDHLENTENKLRPDEASVNDILVTKNHNDVEQNNGIRNDVAPIKHILPNDRFKEIQKDLQNKEDEILSDIVKTHKKYTTTTEKITPFQQNDELMLPTASLIEDLEDQEIPFVDKGPIGIITNITVKPSTAGSHDLAHYIEDVGNEIESAKTHLTTFRPKYSTVIPKKFTTFTSHTTWEEGINEKDLKTNNSKPLHDTGDEYLYNVSTYETEPIQDTNNVILPTYKTSPLQEKDQYILHPQKTTTTTPWSIATYATLPLRDEEVIHPSQSKDVEEQETAIIDKELRPLQSYWKTYIFATTARTTTEDIFTYPTQNLQENDEKGLEDMIPKHIYEMEIQRAQKINENQEDFLYGRYYNTVLEKDVTSSTYATLSLQDDGEDSHMTQKENSFKLKDWQDGVRHTTTYHPIVRPTVSAPGKEKEGGVFYDTLQYLEKEERKTEKPEVSLRRPTLDFEDENEEAIYPMLTEQDNEYQTDRPTFLHRTVSRKNFTRILPIFKVLGGDTNSISPVHSHDEKYTWKEIITNLSRQPVSTTDETILKPNGIPVLKTQSTVSELSPDEIVIPFETTVPPLDEAYSPTPGFDKKINIDFWMDKFFPTKKFTSTNPSTYPSRTPLLQENENKVKGYPTNTSPPVKQYDNHKQSSAYPALGDAIKHWSDFVQEVDKGIPSHMTTKYIQKPTVSLPIGLATTEYHWTSPIQSSDETIMIKPTFFPRPSDRSMQVTDDERKIKPKVHPLGKYSFVPFPVPRKFSTRRPLFIPFTTSSFEATENWSAPQKEIGKETKSQVYQPGKYKYKSNLEPNEYITPKPLFYPLSTSINLESTHRWTKPNKETDSDIQNRLKLGQYSQMAESESNLMLKPHFYPLATSTLETTTYGWTKPKGAFKFRQDEPKEHSSGKYSYIPILRAEKYPNKLLTIENNYLTSESYPVVKDNEMDYPTYSVGDVKSIYTAFKDPHDKYNKEAELPKLPSYQHKIPIPISTFSSNPEHVNLTNIGGHDHKVKGLPHTTANKDTYFIPAGTIPTSTYQPVPIFIPYATYPLPTQLPAKASGPNLHLLTRPELEITRPSIPSYKDTQFKNEKKPFNIFIDLTRAPYVPSFDYINNTTHGYRYPAKGVHSFQDKYFYKNRYIDRHPYVDRYPEKDKFSLIDKYPDKAKYHSKNKYSPNKNQLQDYLDEEKYPPGDDRNKYPTIDIPIFKPKFFPLNKTINSEKERNPDKGEYSDEDRYPNNDRYRPDKHMYYHKDLKNVGGHTYHYILTPARIPGDKDKYPNKDRYPNIDKGKHHYEKKYQYDDKFRQEEKNYQKYPYKNKYNLEDRYAPPGSEYTMQAIFTPKRILDYGDRDKNSNKEIYPNDDKYQGQSPKPPVIPTMKGFDQYGTGLYQDINESIYSPRPSPTDENRYPDNNKYPDRYPDQNNKLPVIPIVKDNNQATDTFEFTNERTDSPRPLIGEEHKNRYPGDDTFPIKDEDYRYNLYSTFPPIPISVLDKQNALKIQSFLDFSTKSPAATTDGYDIIPAAYGNITKDYAHDKRPKVPVLPDAHSTYGLDDSPILKPPVVQGPGEKDATSIKGGELPEMNFENRPTLPYQPEIPLFTELLKKIQLPVAPRLSSTAKVATPKFDKVGQLSEQPQLICGKDHSPVTIVYEGAANIETYPWLGVLIYPRGRFRYNEIIILGCFKMVQ